VIASFPMYQVHPMVTNKSMDEGDAGIVAPMFIEPWVFPFESLSFSLRNLSKGLGLGLPMGICWFDEDVVELLRSDDVSSAFCSISSLGLRWRDDLLP